VLQNLQRGHEDRIQVVHLAVNAGKGEAVRAGARHVLGWKRFEYVGYLDADLAAPLTEVNRFLTNDRVPPGCAVIAGSRIRLMGTAVERSAVRHYLGRVFATFAALTLNLPIYDTQCGCKLIHWETASHVFEEPFLSRWLFDVEILARTVKFLGHEQAMNMIVEVPLKISAQPGESKVRLSDFLKAPLELLKIHLKYRLR
jgi:dolichyl-phosphate beta-glucosyltransferase